MTARSALDDRYGRTRRDRRRGTAWAIAGGAVVVAAVVAWSLWTGLGGAVRSLDVQTVAVVLGDRSIDVRWLVSGRPDQRLVCAIEAQDSAGVVVGLVEEVVPVTGRAERVGDTVVRTVRPATAGLIASCRPA